MVFVRLRPDSASHNNHRKFLLIAHDAPTRKSEHRINRFLKNLKVWRVITSRELSGEDNKIWDIHANVMTGRVREGRAFQTVSSQGLTAIR